MCANSEGSGETARMRRLAWAFAGRPCDKYHNLMSWLKQASIKRDDYNNTKLICNLLVLHTGDNDSHRRPREKEIIM